MIAAHPWNAVQMPLNLLDAQHRSFEKEVLPVRREKGIGVLGMKSLGGGGGTGAIVRETGVDRGICRRYALSLPVSTVICGLSNREDVRAVARIARGFEPLNAAEVDRLLGSTKAFAGDGRVEAYKDPSKGYGCSYQDAVPKAEAWAFPRRRRDPLGCPRAWMDPATGTASEGVRESDPDPAATRRYRHSRPWGVRVGVAPTGSSGTSSRRALHPPITPKYHPLMAPRTTAPMIAPPVAWERLRRRAGRAVTEPILTPAPLGRPSLCGSIEGTPNGFRGFARGGKGLGPFGAWDVSRSPVS